MSYEMVKRLQQKGAVDLLQQLSDGVEAHLKEWAKKHNVWELSFH